MATELTIERVPPDQSVRLLELSRQTFFDAFAHLNSAADMEAYAAKNFTLPKFEAELAHPDSHFFFARIAGEIAGYMKINYQTAQTDIQDANALEVERIYVLHHHQGKQIGKKLIEFAIDETLRKNLTYLCLGVWEHNTNAIRFYENKGFTIFGSHSFMLGEDKQIDLLMRKELNK
ncbi:GNAT family N-acetyltransferase [Mucilaginibacter glaciei]|uniref:GNAT family N-acetyltransferase n=1 Tax=Mucilaginibacter glaciei TaxID=2772109 RepID=A0A926RZT1_9SPHI|nr:GNAT family N-acetyltransferase [Mucilaginibacter glaciei]MBD1392170.1 GNAT family N-acetyltransferase [Mucilaginibacter glaciei]